MTSVEQSVEWIIGRGNLPQCHFVHHLTWAGTRAAAVGSRLLTAGAVERPGWEVTRKLLGCKYTAWEKLGHLSLCQSFTVTDLAREADHHFVEPEGLSPCSQDPGLNESGRTWPACLALASSRLVFATHTALDAHVSKWIFSFQESTTFWCVTPFCLVEAYRYFKGMYCLHLEGQIAKQESSNNCSFSLLLAWSILKSSRWNFDKFLPSYTE
jgi:hypothetical protein